MFINKKHTILLNYRMFSTSLLPDHVLINLPSLSPTMEKGNISKWKIDIGQEIKTGSVLAEIETDKAVVDFEILEDGFLARKFVKEGEKDIKVGTPIALLVTKLADVDSFKTYNLPNVSSSTTSTSNEPKIETQPPPIKSNEIKQRTQPTKPMEQSPKKIINNTPTDVITNPFTTLLTKQISMYEKLYGSTLLSINPINNNDMSDIKKKKHKILKN